MYLFFLFRKSKICLFDRSSNIHDLLPQLKDGDGWAAAQGVLFLIITYLNFDILLQFFPVIHRFFVLSGERMLEWSTNLACWPSEQFFRPLTFDKGWRIVELQPKVLCLLSLLTWILISGCISPSNSLFLCFTWRKDAQMVNKFCLLIVRVNILTSYHS